MGPLRVIVPDPTDSTKVRVFLADGTDLTEVAPVKSVEVKTDDGGLPLSAIIEFGEVHIEYERGSGDHGRQEPLPIISRKQVESLAYHLWLDAGCPRGRADHFWFEAERLLDGEKLVRRRHDRWCAAVIET